MLEQYLKLQNGSDIRGVALDGNEREPVNLTVEISEKIAVSFAFFLSKKTGKEREQLKIGVGHDSRLSAGILKQGIITGLQSAGCTVYDCGLASTPSMFMATQFEETGFDGAIMITASHLPFNRNGFKFFTKAGGLESGDIKEILTAAAETGVVSNEKKAPVFSTDLIGLYAAFLREKIKTEVGEESPLAGLKIVLDASNGSGGFFANQVLLPLGADITGSIYLDPDGTFPNHVPNPENKAAIAAIHQATVSSNADLGVIFDTDVDRAAVVFSSGKEVSRNEIVALMAAIVAKEYPHSTVVTDSVTSDQLTDFIESNLQMKHHRFKRGYRNVINESIRLNKEGIESALAIETSGHCALKENYFLDDGAYMSVKIIIELARCKKSGKALETLIEALEAPAESVEFRPALLDENFAAYGQHVLEQFQIFAQKEPGIHIAPNSYEGIRVSFDSPKGFLLLRLSLHDPQMPLNVESVETGGVHKILEKVMPFFNQMERLDCSCLKDNK